MCAGRAVVRTTRKWVKDKVEGWGLMFGWVRAPPFPPIADAYLLEPVDAYLTSVYQGCHATNCIDGDTTTAEDGQASPCVGMCHSNAGTDVFLRVDYGTSVTVTNVTVYNRHTWIYRLGEYQIWVGDDAEDPTNNIVCDSGVQDADGEASQVLQHVCWKALSGQYMFVLLPGANRQLNLREVQAFGSYNDKPCCSRLEANPIYCCVAARRPDLFVDTCRDSC